MPRAVKKRVGVTGQIVGSLFGTNGAGRLKQLPAYVIPAIIFTRTAAAAGVATTRSFLHPAFVRAIDNSQTLDYHPEICANISARLEINALYD
jgi:hypothetical protein